MEEYCGMTMLPLLRASDTQNQNLNPRPRSTRSNKHHKCLQ